MLQPNRQTYSVEEYLWQEQRSTVKFENYLRLEAGGEYQAMDAQKALSAAKVDQLLLVLKQPNLPLHNNPAELGARQRVRKRDVSLAEAPVQPEDLEGQALVSRSVKTSVAIGEELRTIYQYRPRFTAGCMSIIQPEMGRTGITSFWQICQMAVAFHCRVIPHASIGVGLFQAASLQVAAALPNLVYHEYQHSIFDKNLPYLNGNMRCEAGYFYLPEGAGLGVEPTEELFKYIVSV